MAYKIYIKKNGKLHGPYYYESYREDGKVKKRYIGTKLYHKDSKNVQEVSFSYKKIMPFVVIIALLALSVFFLMNVKFPQPYATLDLQQTYGLNEKLAGTAVITIQSGESIPQETNVDVKLTKDGQTIEESSVPIGDFISASPEELFKDVNVCENVTTDTTENVCHDETTDVTNPDTGEVTTETNQVCADEPVQKTEEKCTTNQESLGFYYNTPGSYSVNLGDLVDYTFNEPGNYVLEINSPDIGLDIQKEFTIEASETGDNEPSEGGGEVNETPENDTLANETIINETIENQTIVNGTINNETITNATLGNETIINSTIINETTVNETIANETLGNQTIEIKTTRARIKLGEPVKWTKNVTLETPENVSIELPKEAENINVTAVDNGLGEEKQADVGIFTITGDVLYGSKQGGGILSFFNSFIGAITGRAIDETNSSGIDNSTVDNSSADVINNDANSVVLDENATEYVITYETPAPTATEEDTNNGKQVTIAAPDELNYTDVLAYTNISEVYSLGQESSIKIYWEENNSYIAFDAYDLDGNGKLDYLEWNVPHLSNQTFDIILITKAEHLDSNRTFVEDVYDYVKDRDYSYTTIPSGDYLRVTFQQELTNKNDITLYAKSNSSAAIEVYEKDSDEKIADFGTINEDGMYKILLTNLQDNHDTFDLKVIGDAGSGVDFDYVIDPSSDGCLQFGSSGSFVAGSGGILWLWFNDEYHLFDDNSGQFAVNVSNSSFSKVYNVSAANDTGTPIEGLISGQTYVYTAVGNVSWNTVYCDGQTTQPGGRTGPNKDDLMYQLNCSGDIQSFGTKYILATAICSRTPAMTLVASNDNPPISLPLNWSTNWSMFHQYLNHTAWDGIVYPTIPKVKSNYTTGALTGAIAYSSPAIANGYLYIGSQDGNVYQLDASNIIQLFHTYQTGSFSVQSSPAIANGYLYIGSDSGWLYQLDATNITQLIARYPTSGAVGSSPAIANGYVYVGGEDGNVYQLNASKITQLINIYPTGAAIDSSPAVATIDGISYVYIGSQDGNVYQLNASNITQLVNIYTTNAAVYSSPSVSNGYVYIGSDDGNLYQLNATNVAQLISSYQTYGVMESSPAIANGYVYAGFGDSVMYQLNATNISKQIANFITGQVKRSSPAVANGYVYVGSQDGNLYQLNATNISINIANFTTGAAIESSPAVANGYVYVGSDDGNVYQLNATDLRLPDTVSPTVNLVSPANNRTIHNAAVSFNAIFTDNVALKNETFYLWNSTLDLINTSTQAKSGRSNTSNFAVTLPYFGNFTWNYLVYDTGGNFAWNETNATLSYSAANNVTNTSEAGVNEWWMYRRWLNHTAWDGIPYSTIPGRNVATYTTGGAISYSSPAIANGYAYVGSADGKVYQLNASNAMQLINSYSTGGAVVSSPAVANGYIYVGSNDGVVYQLNATNISLLISNSAAIGGSFQSSPAVANGYSYIGGSDGNFYQLNATDLSQVIATYPMGSIDSSPAVATIDGISYVYIADTSGNLYQLNATNVAQLIAINPLAWGMSWSSPAVANGYVYIGGMDAVLHQLNASNIAQQITTYGVGCWVESSPAVANGYVYIGDVCGDIRQLDANDISQLVASYSIGSSNHVDSSPAVANGYVYVGGQDKKVYQFDANDISQLVASYTTGGAIYSSPAVANGYVYVGSNDKKLYQLNATDISSKNNFPPIVNLIVPTNGVTTARAVQSFNATIIADTQELVNATFYLWNSTNDLVNTTINTVSGTGDSVNLSVTLPYFGDFKWNYLACDINGNCGWNNTNYTLSFINANQSSESGIGNWSMFRQYLNHTAWDGVSYSTIPGLNRANYTTGSSIIYSSPAVANGYMYIGVSDGNLYQLNASNVSKLIASYLTNNSITYSSPAVANGYVYVGSDDGNVYQFNASNVSKLIASYPTSGAVYSSPAVANGYVYVGGGSTVYQFNASNVAQLVATYPTGATVYSSPAVANGYVYVGSQDGYVYQLSAIDISQLIAFYPTGGAAESSPAVANGYVYIGSDDNKVYQLNASDISQAIASYSIGGVAEASLAVANGYVYAGSYDNRLYQLNATNISKQIANYTTGNWIYSTPTVANGYVYIGSYDGYVYQLNATNISKQIANYTTGGAVSSSPAVANGYVYIGSYDTNIYQLNATNIGLDNPLSDTIYPLFSNYKDNNGTLTNSGKGIFNVTANNTNGTVWMSINGVNITAKNYSLSFYNLSYQFTTNGTYPYIWYAYGNGTNHNLNFSDTKYYYVNYTDTIYPKLSNNLTTPANGSQYLSGRIYQFNITVNNTNGTAGIEFNSVNYSLSNLSSSFYKTFTDLGVGVYPYYYWAYGNGSANLLNQSQKFYYTVIINSSYVLSLTEAPSGTWSEAYGIQTNITGSCPSQLTCNLFQNNISISNAINQTLTAGKYSYLFNTTGNGNYSSNTINSNLTINLANQSMTPLLNGVGSNLAVTYPQQVNASFSGVNRTLLTITINGTQVNPNQNYTYGVGWYNVTWSAPSNNNYTAYLGQLNITVSQGNGRTGLIFDKTSSQTYGTAITPTCSVVAGQGTPILTVNRTTITSGSPITLGAGTWTFNCSLALTNNYTYAENVSTFTIDSAGQSITSLLNGISSNLAVTYPQQVNASYSGTNKTLLTITINGTQVNPSQNYTYGVGWYNVTWSAPSNNNYTAYLGQLNITVSQGTSLINLTLNGTQNNVSVIQGSSIPLNCSLISGDNSGILSLFNNSGLLGSGTKSIQNLTAFNTLGLQNITCSYSSTQNYSTSSMTYYVNVLSDTIFPVFSNYKDNNATLTNSGKGIFNVTANNTNGTVWMSINGVNITAKNYSLSFYNLSYQFTTNGTYPYIWYAYGNGSSHNLNYSDTKYYYVNYSDTIYPIFSAYQDDNASVVNSGTGRFNVTMANTNGTVLLEINNQNYTARNDTLNVYNVSVLFATNGTYSYKWHSWGNGSAHNYNVSDMRNYYVNYSDTVYPLFSNFLTSINNGSQYLSGRNYQFNTTITNTNGTAGIEFNSVNYSLSNLSSSFYTSFTDLGAGVYPYYYWAYGSGLGHLLNQTQIFYYTVVINNSYVLSLTELPSGIWEETYGTQTNVTGNGCPSQLTCNLFQNNISISNAINQTLTAGKYSYLFNTTGNSNYSSNTTNSNLTINLANQSIISLLNGVNSNLAVTYPQQVNASFSGVNKTLLTITINGTQVNPSQNYTYGVGWYNVTWSAPSNNNYTAYFGQLNITINSASSTTLLKLNDVIDNITLTYPQQINASASCDYGTLILLRNGTDVTGMNSQNTTLGGGYWNYTATCSGDGNHLPSFNVLFATINQANQSITPLLNGISSNLVVDYPQQVNASYSGVNYTLLSIFVNGTQVNPSQNYTYGAGVYNSTWSAPSSNNYTAYLGQLNITVNQVPSLVNLTFNGAQGNATIAQGSSISLNCSLITGDSSGVLNLFNNGSLVNSGTKSIQNLTVFSILGLQNITCSYDSTQNYSTSSATYYVNVIVNSYPMFSNFLTSIGNGSQYLYRGNYQFNTTITNTNGTAGVEFNAVNYSLSNLSSSFYISFTDLGAGVYPYYYWAYGSGGSGLLNQTEMFYYTVISNSSYVLSLTELPSGTWEETYPTETKITGMGCPLEIGCDLYENNVSIGSGISQTLGAGTYNYIYNLTGSDNYLPSTVNHDLIISPASSPPSGGGGGGGGGGAIDSFGVDKNLITSVITQGGGDNILLTLTSYSDKSINVNLRMEGLEGLTAVFPESISLNPKESRTVGLDLFAPTDVKSGVYTGKLILEEGSTRKTINMAIEVRERTPLFDVKLVLLSGFKRVVEGHKVTSRIDMSNIGLRGEPVDANLTLSVEDFNKSTIYEAKGETLAVTTDLAIERSFVIPPKTPVGQYIILATLKYNNATAQSFDTFEVIPVAQGIREMEINIVILIVFGGLICILAVYLKRRVEQYKHMWAKYEKLPQ